MVKDREAWCAAVHGVTKSLNNNNSNYCSERRAQTVHDLREKLLHMPTQPLSRRYMVRPANPSPGTLCTGSIVGRAHLGSKDSALHRQHSTRIHSTNIYQVPPGNKRANKTQKQTKSLPSWNLCFREGGRCKQVKKWQ